MKKISKIAAYGFFAHIFLIYDSHCEIIDLNFLLQRYKQNDDPEHNYLFDLIFKMLEFEPADRITLKEALAHPFFDKIPSNQRLGEQGAGDMRRNRSLSVSR